MHAGRRAVLHEHPPKGRQDGRLHRAERAEQAPEQVLQDQGHKGDRAVPQAPLDVLLGEHRPGRQPDQDRPVAQRHALLERQLAGRLHQRQRRELAGLAALKARLPGQGLHRHFGQRFLDRAKEGG